MRKSDYSKMKFHILLFLLYFINIPEITSAQLSHFLYLQTEEKQPFYVKLDKKVLSSSSNGYLIIPKLQRGVYSFAVGFPNNTAAPANYTCTIQDGDAGYLIKNFGEKGWGLFNLQTLDIIMANSAAQGGLPNKADKKSDDFSSMLSQVINDPSIKEPISSGILADTNVNQPQVENQPVATATRSLIKKTYMDKIGGETRIQYVITEGDTKDTVTVILAENSINEKDTIRPAVIKQLTYDTVKADNKTSFIKPANDNGAGRKAPIQDPEKNNATVMSSAKPEFLPIEVSGSAKSDSLPPKTAPLMVNSDCKTYASEDDFLKLRKKMASESTEEQMIIVAQKFLKAKCFTTDQVKNLSVLFLQDSGKYRFFDMAYPFVSDSYNFHQLEGQLTDNYYITRFKAMVRH